MREDELDLFSEPIQASHIPNHTKLVMHRSKSKVDSFSERAAIGFFCILLAAGSVFLVAAAIHGGVTSLWVMAGVAVFVLACFLVGWAAQRLGWFE